jgi:hypothetical protein
MQIQNQNQDHNRDQQPAQPRKLTLKKETLRQLTSRELKLVAGGARGITHNNQDPLSIFLCC